MPRRTAASVLTFCTSASLLLSISCARRYAVRGVVLRADPAARTLLVAHSDIRGYMPAMAMPFQVEDAREMRGIAAGSRVEFELVVRKQSSRARKLRVRRESAGGLALREPAGKIAVGSPVPDFALQDPRGNPVRLSDFRGKAVAIDFIYTRCPLPEVCPRLSANFARLQRRFADRLDRGLQLLSITIDPQYDRGEVLENYAKIWGAKGNGWLFLTGDLVRVREIAEGFGMLFWPEEGVLVHTSRIALIGRDGRLAALLEGADFQFGQLAALVESALEGK